MRKENDALLPLGYAGKLMVELEENWREEEAAIGFIMSRARSLAWQAVRCTPRQNVCVKTCLAWLRRARIWGARRELDGISDEIATILKSLEERLPLLERQRNHNYGASYARTTSRYFAE